MEMIHKQTIKKNDAGDCRGKILVVDDDKVIRDVILNLLCEIGFESVGAENPLEGMTFFSSRHFDLILTDMEMPNMDGVSFAAHIKGMSPNTPVVLMSGQTKERILKKVKGGHIDRILIKPFGFQELSDTIQLLLINPDLKRDIFNPLMEVMESTNPGTT